MYEVGLFGTCDQERGRKRLCDGTREDTRGSKDVR